MLGDIFSLVLCDFHTVKWCKESIDMVHIKWTLWILIYVVCTKFVFCRKLILKALFRFNGTSKPLLTIDLKILKTIEKPLIPMVGPSKNIQWWFVLYYTWMTNINVFYIFFNFLGDILVLTWLKMLQNIFEDVT